MSLDSGIVTYYDGEYGEIKKENEKYIFLGHDLMSDINTGDFVSFRGEEVRGTKRAYFVNSLENKENLKDYKEKLKELM